MLHWIKFCSPTSPLQSWQSHHSREFTIQLLEKCLSSVQPPHSMQQLSSSVSCTTNVPCTWGNFSEENSVFWSKSNLYIPGYRQPWPPWIVCSEGSREQQHTSCLYAQRPFPGRTIPQYHNRSSLWAKVRVLSPSKPICPTEYGAIAWESWESSALWLNSPSSMFVEKQKRCHIESR